jgi:hypothetical protein
MMLSDGAWPSHGVAGARSRRYVRRYRTDRVRPASAGLDVLRRSSWSSPGTNRGNRCPTVEG